MFHSITLQKTAEFNDINSNNSLSTTHRVERKRLWPLVLDLNISYTPCEQRPVTTSPIKSVIFRAGQVSLHNCNLDRLERHLNTYPLIKGLRLAVKQARKRASAVKLQFKFAYIGTQTRHNIANKVRHF